MKSLREAAKTNVLYKGEGVKAGPLRKKEHLWNIFFCQTPFLAILRLNTPTAIKLDERGALMACPLLEELFFAASLRRDFQEAVTLEMQTETVPTFKGENNFC